MSDLRIKICQFQVWANADSSFKIGLENKEKCQEMPGDHLVALEKVLVKSDFAYRTVSVDALVVDKVVEDLSSSFNNTFLVSTIYMKESCIRISADSGCYFEYNNGKVEILYRYVPTHKEEKEIMKLKTKPNPSERANK